ncbi:MAG: DHH family phosphoesterase [Desulforhopalus sp.]|nr:DHH family phosphoesterase [Desulforhopalus sp.]
MHYDIFNGDADGIFSLHQFRLSTPFPEAQLITGVKRDICLLAQLENLCGCVLTVFDISLDSNRLSLLKILHGGNEVTYFDHHYAGDPISGPGLHTHIDPSPATCTSLVVDKVFHHQHGLWAICGAFGDNLLDQALNLAKSFRLSDQQTEQLRELGELFNYNGYGSTLEDLHFHPQELYEAIRPYTDPFDYLANTQQVNTLRVAYQTDIALAMQQEELTTIGINRVYHLPNASWARRAVGVFSNRKARELPAAAHAIITDNPDGTLRISVRAPLADPHHADTLCKLYPTGGGRSAAAGINILPKDLLDQFLKSFHSFYSRQ